MLGSEGPGPAERWVAGGRLAAALDAVDMLRAIPGIRDIVFATSEGELAATYPHLPDYWDVDRPGGGFQFGARLAELTAAHPAPAYLYLGAGSVPLLPAAVLAQAVEEVARADCPLAVTNNLHSSDWMAFNCPEAIGTRPERLMADNALGWVLHAEAGIEVRSLLPSAATRVDIDTPADLLLLALHPQTGPQLRRYLREQPHNNSRWVRAGRRLFTPGGQVTFIGRVASGVWAHVEAKTQAWIRVLSEERGMSASGRQAAGQVRSLVGAHLDRLGPQAFFAELAEMTEAVFFDTRVLLAHARRWPPAEDRYASDLGLPDQVGEAYLHDVTAAAMSAPLPVVLGGHGVVAGDLYGLVEIAAAGRLQHEAGGVD